MMTVDQIPTVEIATSLFGRDVALTCRVIGDKAYSEPLFHARCGRTGTKRWRTGMIFWRQPDGSWKPDFVYYKLNRNTGRILGWWE